MSDIFTSLETLDLVLRTNTTMYKLEIPLLKHVQYSAYSLFIKLSNILAQYLLCLKGKKSTGHNRDTSKELIKESTYKLTV